MSKKITPIGSSTTRLRVARTPLETPMPILVLGGLHENKSNKNTI